MSTTTTPRFRPSYKTCASVSDLCPLAATTYGYYPDLAGNIVFAVWFGVLLILALGFGIKSKTWTYTLALGIGALGECLGYVGRIIMHDNPWNSSAFQMQICCLILAPSFLAAAIYLTLKHLVLNFGAQHSVLKPRLYPWVFVGCDFFSIVLQAIGGGVASSAGRQASAKLLDTGNGLIIAGIAFQVATMVACGLLAALYVFKYKKAKKVGGSESEASEKGTYDRKERKKLVIFCAAIGLAYITILIRCVYRLPEMAGGWGNPLMRNEKEFLILDGAMVAISTFCLTVFHPMFFFPAMARKETLRTDQGVISNSE